MITNVLQRLVTLFKYLLISLLAITFSRFLLYFFNPDYFGGLEFPGLLNMLWQGLRFDLSALAAYQAPFILLFFLPFPEKWAKVKHALLLSLFSLANFVLITFSSIDSIYFRFTLKRSTADLFSFVATGDDTLRLLPQFFKDYWFIPLLIALLLWLSIKAFKQVKSPVALRLLSFKFHSLNILALLLVAGLVVLAIRGGFQLKPIRVIQAAEAVGVHNAPLVLNTPFTIMKTFNKESLKEKHYFDEEKRSALYNPIKHFLGKKGQMKRKNVVIIIMESFSKEYMGAPFGLENKTPFLDSLAKESLFFDRAFANGKKSIEGIPAIVAGIPSLMADPYITSVYSNNQIETIASILKSKGYATSFFHGGTTGTMGFDAFTKLAGFEHYYGMEDYEGGENYDGNWGIFDEPFFQFFGNKLGKMPEPFLATFFSLSSHHPYTIPKQYTDRFSGGKHPLLNTIAYADMALRKFFEAVKAKPWYNNTLFVITADHTGQSFNPSFATQLGNFAVPLLFYAPGDSTLKGVSEIVTQQIDILPTVLGYLGCHKPFFGFGRNGLSPTQQGFAVNYLNNIYQYVAGDYVIHFDGEKTIGYYCYKDDKLLRNSLKPDARMVKMEERCKAIIQTYNSVLVHNRQNVVAYRSKSDSKFP